MFVLSSEYQGVNTFEMLYCVVFVFFIISLNKCMFTISYIYRYYFLKISLKADSQGISSKKNFFSTFFFSFSWPKSLQIGFLYVTSDFAI